MTSLSARPDSDSAGVASAGAAALAAAACAPRMAATAQYTLRFAFKLLSPIFNNLSEEPPEPPDLLAARRAHATGPSAGGTPTPNFHGCAVPFKLINWIGPSNKVMAAYSSP